MSAAHVVQEFFNELTSERARELFGKFVDLWNRRQLPAKYYRGIEGTIMRRTQHSWAVKGPLWTQQHITSCIFPMSCVNLLP